MGLGHVHRRTNVGFQGTPVSSNRHPRVCQLSHCLIEVLGLVNAARVTGARHAAPEREVTLPRIWLHPFEIQPALVEDQSASETPPAIRRNPRQAISPNAKPTVPDRTCAPLRLDNIGLVRREHAPHLFPPALGLTSPSLAA
jgi:hypothetical protein